jgi:hypothetical protein
MNWPLLPVMPAFDDELGAVEDALDPLEVVIEPFHEPMQPVYVTGRPVGVLYDCDEGWPACELGCEVVAGACAPSVTPAIAIAPQAAKMFRVMRAS